jgi:hypothetical protein
MEVAMDLPLLNSRTKVMPGAAQRAAALAAASPLLSARAPWPAAERLVVLVPAGLKSDEALAARVVRAVQGRRLSVLYLGLTAETTGAFDLSYRLARLAAFTRNNDGVAAGYELAIGADWLACARAAWQPGDLMVCHAEQRVPGGLLGRPLAPLLAAALEQPVLVLEDLCSRQSHAAWTRLARGLLFWVGALALVGGTVWLLASIDGATAGVARAVVESVVVVVALGVLAVWNAALSGPLT